MVYHPGGLSPFRAGFLNVELFISGSWVKVTDAELSEEGVEISRGSKPGSTNGADPGQLAFSLKDPTGKWSPRHPSSPYYGLIGRGTPIRVRVEPEAAVSYTRFQGEIVTFAPEWTRKGGPSARVNVEAAGIFRRLGQGQSPLISSLTRYNSSLSASGGLVAFWPMEGGTDAGQFPSLIDPDRPMSVVSGAPSAGAYEGVYGSEALPTIGSSVIEGFVPAHTAGAYVNFRWFGIVPLATVHNSVITRLYLTTGDVSYVDLIYRTGGDIQYRGFRQDGTLIGGLDAVGLGLDDDNPVGISVELVQSGSAVNVSLRRIEIYPSSYVSATSGPLVLASSTLGRAHSVVINPGGVDQGSLSIGQISVQKNSTGSLANVFAPATGNRSETASDRVTRLAGENGLTVEMYSASTGGEKLGPQGSAELLELLKDAAEADGGILYEPAATEDIGYIKGLDLMSQSPRAFTFVDNMFVPMTPVEDDSEVANKVTVSRRLGASSTYEETSGTLGTAAIGVYDDSRTLNLWRDDQTKEQATWRAHLGTWDEARYPEIGFDLSDYRLLAPSASATRNLMLGTRIGNRITITDIPEWLPPFDVDQLVVGIKETIRSDSYKIVWNCTPARPYRGAHWMVSASATNTDRWSGEGTTLFASISASATSLSGVLPTGVQWTAADGSYQIILTGEIMTVTAVAAPSSGRQTFTVVRAVNGVSKAHTAGESISLADPAYWTL